MSDFENIIALKSIIEEIENSNYDTTQLLDKAFKRRLVLIEKWINKQVLPDEIKLVYLRQVHIWGEKNSFLFKAKQIVIRVLVAIAIFSFIVGFFLGGSAGGLHRELNKNLYVISISSGIVLALVILILYIDHKLTKKKREESIIYLDYCAYLKKVSKYLDKIYNK